MKRFFCWLRGSRNALALPILTGAAAAALLASLLLPNRVLDTYELNLSGPDDQETVLTLAEGSVLWHTMNTGQRPLRGIQPGLSLQGCAYETGQIRCRVYSADKTTLLSDNVYPLSELTENVRGQMAQGGASLAWQPLYTYIPFAEYERCKGDIAIAFSYESQGGVPEPFAESAAAAEAGTGEDVAAPAGSGADGTGEDGAAPAGSDAAGADEPCAAPGILINDVQNPQTSLEFAGEALAGGLCGYRVYTHNTYPLVYDLRLLLCMGLAACAVPYARGSGGRRVREMLARLARRGKAAPETDGAARCGEAAPEAGGAIRRAETAPEAGGAARYGEAAPEADGAARYGKAAPEAGGAARHGCPAFLRRVLPAMLASLAAALCLEAAAEGHAFLHPRYESVLTDDPGVRAETAAGTGREKLSPEEENALLRELDNARILAGLSGEPESGAADGDYGEGITREADGFYRGVSRTRLELTLPEPLYIHTLRLGLPAESGNRKIRLWADGEEAADGEIDGRILTGAYVLNRSCRTLTVELTGEEALPGDVSLTASNVFSFCPARFFFFFAACLLAALFACSRRLFAERPEAAFAVCSLLLGTALIAAVGMGQEGYDEQIHFKAAYERSFGATVLTTESAMQLEAASMPSFRSAAEREAMERYAEGANDYARANITHQSRFPGYEVRSYLPSSVFLFLGRILRLPFVWCVMLGKFGNLLCYTLVCAAAVRCAAQGKALVAAIALLPNCVFAASCYSYDTVVNGFLLLGVVLLLNRAGEPGTLSRTQVLALLAVFLCGSTAKAIYILMLFPLLLWPDRKAGGRLRAAFLRLGTLAVMFWLLYSFFFPPVSASSNYEMMGNLAYAGDKRSAGTSVLGQISWIAGHLSAYAALLARSMLGELWQYVSGGKPFAAYGYLGALGGWATWLGLLALLGAALLTPEGERRTALPRRMIAGNVLLVLGMSAVIWTSMYVTFTAVGAETISGVQGRYFLPLFLPFFSCLFQNRLHVPLGRERYTKLIFGVLTAVNLWGIWTLAVQALNR